MLNKTISLTGPQLDKVEAIMTKHNLTFSAAIRKIIDGYNKPLLTSNKIPSSYNMSAIRQGVKLDV